ncbi:MAG: alpha/beta fold hydrolase, partial [Tateyamaria sp.]
YADALRRFLDDLDLSTVHLLGHSLGTLIAAAFARKCPERLNSLILVSAAGGYGIKKGGMLPDKVRARIDDLERLGPVAFAGARAANLVHDPKSNAPVVAQVQAAMAQINPKGYAQAVQLLASGDLPADMLHVPFCPGFILGAADRITPRDQTDAAALAWETAHGVRPPVHMIEGAGHAVYLQKPREFCAALMTLLQEQARSVPGSDHHHEET